MEERLQSNIKKISFVIPCYRSENTIEKVVGEIRETMKMRPEYTYEIVLVNDGSPDNVWEVIRRLSREENASAQAVTEAAEIQEDAAERGPECGKVNVNGCVIGVDLAKNFGQHCALMAGYKQAKGDIIVSLDDDGQTAPSEVFKLLDKLEEGYDVVYATYPEYHQTWFRKWGSDFAHKMTNFVFGFKEDTTKGTSYFATRRFIVDEILRYDHPYPAVGGLILRATRNIAYVPVEHRERISGSSGYTLRTLIALWMNGFTAFSVRPLELGAYVGVLFSAIGFLFALITIIRKLVNPDIQAGWSSMMSALMIIGGIIMLMLALIGEYIGRIYICINNAPQYVVREVVGESKIKVCN